MVPRGKDVTVRTVQQGWVTPKEVLRKTAWWQLLQGASQLSGSQMATLFSPTPFFSPHEALELWGRVTEGGNSLLCVIVYVCGPSPFLHNYLRVSLALEQPNLGWDDKLIAWGIKPFLTWSWLPHSHPPFPVFCSVLFQPWSQITYSECVHAGCAWRT